MALFLVCLRVPVAINFFLYFGILLYTLFAITILHIYVFTLLTLNILHYCGLVWSIVQCFPKILKMILTLTKTCLRQDFVSKFPTGN